MVMQFYPGRTLKEERRAMEGAPNETWLRSFVDPLLGALELLHSEGVYHRDISPDNILLLPDGRPVLLDFGAARRVIGNRTQTLTAILKPNFAPVEQYADVVGMRQGPWTDLYALGAVIRFMVTAHPPTPAAARAVHDDMLGLATPEHATRLDVSPTFLSAIVWALVVRPQERPQSVHELRDALNGTSPALRASTSQMQVTVSMPASKPSAQPVTARQNVGRKTKGGGYRVAQIAGIAAVVLVSVAAAMWTNPKPATPVESARMERRVPATPVAVTLAPVKAIEPPVSLPMAETEITRASPTQSRASESMRNLRRKRVADAVASRGEVSPSAVGGQPSTVAPSRPVPPAQPVAPIVAQSPRQACGDRMILTMVICMSRECRTPRFQHHPQCLEMQRAEALRHETQMTH
jgi:serine/threonine protein kinase